MEADNRLALNHPHHGVNAVTAHQVVALPAVLPHFGKGMIATRVPVQVAINDLFGRQCVLHDQRLKQVPQPPLTDPPHRLLALEEEFHAVVDLDLVETLLHVVLHRLALKPANRDSPDQGPESLPVLTYC